jgi:tyrosine-protein kinase Etk/Wzc
METNIKRLQPEEDNLFHQFMFRFLPYWPLFAGLLVTCVAAGFVYLRYATPLYEISATMLIKDEKKGLDDSKIMESLNIFSPNSIVENEMEVLQSRGLMSEVVNKLHLYAPVFSEGRINSISAYQSSPVIVSLANPELLDTSLADKKIYFTYETDQKVIHMENKIYPLNQWINTSYGTLKFISNPNFQKIKNKNFYFFLVSPKKITNSVLENLQVTAPNKLTTIIKLALKDESPKRGEDIINELINTYNLASIDDKNEFSKKTLSIVTDKLTSVQSQVDSIQKLINQYKEQNGIVNLSEQSTLFLQDVGDNDQKVSDVNRQIAVLDEVEEYVKSKDHNDGVIPTTLGVNDPVLSNLIQRLYDLEINYQRLKMTATENNPTMVSLANDIEKTKSNILESTRIQSVSLNASRKNLNTTLDTYSSKLKNIPNKERALIEISRQLAALNSTYDFLIQKKEEASLSNASTLASSRTVDKAESSIKPISPKQAIILFMTVGFAFTLGIVIVICKENFGSKILFRSDIHKYTRIPVIAEILNVKKKTRRLTEDQKNTIITEQFRQLIACMGLYGKNVARKKILVTSSISGEGKSFVSTNLASTLAVKGKKVILLDFDFRNPNVSRSFNISEEVGISDFLEGEKELYEIIKSSSQSNLFIAGTGSVPLEKVGELFSNERLTDLFNYLEEVFDFIIVDTPPVEPISDAYILSEYCDASLYVLRHGYTPKTIIQLLDQNSETKTLKNIALVFNAVKPRGFIKHTYGYGYGFNYQYAYNQKRKKTRA